MDTDCLESGILKINGICKYLQNDLGSCFYMLYMLCVYCSFLQHVGRRVGKSMIQCNPANLHRRSIWESIWEQPAVPFQAMQPKQIHIRESQRISSRPAAYTAIRTSAPVSGSTQSTAVCSNSYPVCQ